MIQREVGPVDRVAFLHQTSQRGNVHVGGDSRKVRDQATNRDAQNGAAAFQDLHLHFVADLSPDDFREFGRHDQPLFRQGDGAALIVQQTVEIRARRDAGDGEFAVAVTKSQTGRHTADRFGADHAWQVFEIVESAARAGLGEKYRHVLPLLAVPLEGQQVVDAVAHRAGQHH